LARNAITLIVFVLWFGVAAAQDPVPVVRFNVSSFAIVGNNPLDKATTDTLLAPYLGPQEGLDRLFEAVALLEKTILDSGFSFYRVVLPPQTMEAGVITLKVLTIKVARINTSGNKYFSDDNVRASLPGLKLGATPDTRELSRQLIVANNHTAKQVTIRMQQSDQPDRVDVELAVRDQRPWKLFTSLNNTGSDATGEFRFTAGAQYSNLFDLDHEITASYTTAPGHVGDVQQYGFNYRLPLYRFSGDLALFYSSSDVDTGRVAQVFDVSGAGRFKGATYTQTFNNINSYRHQASVAVEDRLFNNTLADPTTGAVLVDPVTGRPLVPDVRSRPLTLGYHGEYVLERSRLNFNVSYSRNLTSGRKNDNTTYGESRAGADVHWQALRFSASASHALPGQWLLNGALSGQLTGEPLISGEQFGVGGVGSVRGYEERAATGDKGLRGSLEVWTPSAPFLANLRMIGFVDAGYVKSLKTAGTGQLGSDTLLSAGVGLRWQWKNQLNLQLDYGHSLRDARTADAGGTKIHLRLFYGF